MIRLLFVDGSDLMGWLVARLIPHNVEIVRVGSFVEADRFLREQRPDAAIFNLTPRHLDWRTLIDRCLHHEPVIPFLCCTAIENDEELDGRLPCRPEDYFTKSVPLKDLRLLVNRLVEEGRTNRPDRFSRQHARCGVPADRKPA